MPLKTLSTFGLALLVLVAAPAAQARRAAAAPVMQVYKTPTCGCCSKWVDHVRNAGFEVRFTDMSQAELDKVKAEYNVPAAVHSCHTGVVGGYVVEGHVPASEVKRLLNEKPKVVGIAVPAMPVGSPGMEVPSVKPQPYDVLTFDRTGKTGVYSTQRP